MICPLCELPLSVRVTVSPKLHYKDTERFGVCWRCGWMWRYVVQTYPDILKFRLKHKMYILQYVNSIGGYEVTFDDRLKLQIWRVDSC